MIVVMVDKMLKTQIVECASVVKWAFSDTIREAFTSFFLWEIVHSAINRMGKQVEKVRAEYANMQERLKKSSLDPDSVQSEISEEELEQKLTTLNSLKRQQKDLFFLVVDRFVERLTQHLNNSSALSQVKIEEGAKVPFADGPHFYKWALERFEDVILSVIITYIIIFTTYLCTINSIVI